MIFYRMAAAPRGVRNRKSVVRRRATIFYRRGRRGMLRAAAVEKKTRIG